ncbi:SAF domain-containing protein [Auraticoccus monumenti]|uniref:Flp pilus assembly protein CpaB n=1 Tax=Auraticoccus monumenti TaxID=675864 RepID=A0A1G6YIH0_9ACTN|nr:SAF domain-containing protein [Auraticoccus monumenti]SDD90102.1 Flp pilus assembly protein CpaB [Auraticoccus monumenti]
MDALSLHGLRRAVSWHRRPLAAAAAVLAVLATVTALSPQAPPGSPVVVSASALGSGVRLGTEDLVVRWVQPEVLPEGAVTDPAAVVGRTLAAPLTAGSMLTDVDVVAPRSEDGRDGGVLAPVRLADAEVVGLLRVGDTVDVLGADAASGAVGVVATDARVASLPRPDEEGGLFASGPSSGALVLVEVSSSTSLALAQASAAGPLSLVLG